MVADSTAVMAAGMVVVDGSWEAYHKAVDHIVFAAVVVYFAVEVAGSIVVDHRVGVMEAKEVAGSFSTLSINTISFSRLSLC